jgi:hypothetical protein
MLLMSGTNRIGLAADEIADFDGLGFLRVVWGGNRPTCNPIDSIAQVRRLWLSLGHRRSCSDGFWGESRNFVFVAFG